MAEQSVVAAIVPAAGRSTRMGTPKQLLPWNGSTVIATVVANLAAAGCDPVVVVTGHSADDVRAALADTEAQTVANADYLQGEMISSYRAGIRHLLTHAVGGESLLGTLLALGDQPHVPVHVIRDVVQQARKLPDKLVIPSHTMRRGHPFYLPLGIWSELLALDESETLRDLVRRHERDIVYVESATNAILLDMDTPGDYAALRDEPKR